MKLFAIQLFSVACLNIILMRCAPFSGMHEKSRTGEASPLPEKQLARLSILAMPVNSEHFPEVRLKLVIKDDASHPVIGLAPPYGKLDNWHLLWKPGHETHPDKGMHLPRKFEVIEHQPDLSADDKMRLIGLENRHLMLLLDMSGSMTGKILEKAKSAALQFIDHLDMPCGLIAFNDNVVVSQRFTTNKDSLRKRISAISSGGGTHLYDALYAAIQLLKQQTGQCIIVVLTDGETSGDKFSLHQVVHFAGGMASGDSCLPENCIRIFPVGYNYRGENLKILAHRTGGNFYFAESAHELLSAFRTLSSHLASQFYYQVAYTSPFPEKDGSHREFSFSFADTILKAAYRAPISSQSFILSGEIVDGSTKQAVPGAQITVKPASVEQALGAQASTAGKYRIEIPRAMGRYTIYAHAPDYFISVIDTFLDMRGKYSLERNIALSRLKKGISVMLRMIHFKNDEYEIDAKSITDLEIVTEYFLNNPHLIFEVSGHTDDLGTEAYNQQLSEKRARSVRDFFISRGIPSENISHSGFGENHPMVPNTSMLNRSLNRRVEIKILDLVK
ncbi:OmpA family protein [candidate division KSB1 bacterium]|nr:OmpA family protein [candidate division KSB1 bacterium]